MLSAVAIWKQSPMLRLLLPLVAGIIFYHFFPVSFWLVLILLIIGIATLLLMIKMPLKFEFTYGFIKTFGVYLIWMSTGMMFCYRYNFQHHENWYEYYANKNSHLIINIKEPPVEKPHTFKAIANVMAVADSSMHPASGKIIAYFSKDSLSNALQYGDILEVKNVLENIHNEGNPGEFDYATYCARKNIFQQAFFQAGQWKIIQPAASKGLHYYLFKLRDKCIGILDKYIPGQRTSAIAEALLLGYRDNVDKAMLQAYADAGVIHIIAISGLHLGLIYLLLIWLLKPLGESKRSARWIKTIIILFVLWFFALLTGGRPAVMRTAIMFSMLTIGRLLLNRPATTYNALFASAFLLLCFDPNLLFDVGFQLSYLAVLGIISYQRPVYLLLHFTWWLPDKIWQLMSVSIAAQIFTLPVCLYYFHQFPLLFFITNIFMVPLASLVLILLIILMIICWWNWLAVFAGKFIAGCIWLMNTTVLRVSHYHWSRISAINISLIETILLYAIILAVIAWIIRKQAGILLLAFSLILLLAINISFQDIQYRENKKMIVLNIAHHDAIEFVNGNNIYFTGDSALINNQMTARQEILPTNNYLQATIQNPDHQYFYRHQPIIQFYQKKILIIDSGFHQFPADMIKVNYVILSHNPSISIHKIHDWCRFDTIIMDASNKWWKIREWKNECEQLNLPHFSVPDQGAFIANL